MGMRKKKVLEKISRQRKKDRKTMAEKITNQNECADVVEQ